MDNRMSFSERLAQITLIIAIIAVCYFVFSYAQGSIKFGKTVVNTDSPLEDGLVVHYTFDGPDLNLGSVSAEILDISGNDNHGDWVNHSTTTAIGVIGQGLLRNVDSPYIDVTTDASFNDMSTITACMWVYPDRVTGSAYPNLVSTYDDPEVGWDLYLRHRADGYGIGTSYGTGSGYVLKETNNLYVPLNTWSHVCATQNGDDASNMALYVNGSVLPLGGSDTGVRASDAGNNLQIWNSLASPSSDDFSGKIDDVRIYNRVLSANEITNLYNFGSLKVSKTVDSGGDSSLKDGLIGHWTFDGPYMLTNVADSSGNGRHGGLTGQTSTTTVIGLVGQALVYDGVDDRVSVSPNSSINNLSLMSVCTWINKIAGTSNWMNVISKTTNGSNGWNMYTHDSGSSPIAFYTPSQDYLGSTAVLTRGVWAHVCATWDGTDGVNGIRIYTNGVNTTAATSSGGIGGGLTNDSSFNLVLGGDAGNAYPFKGMLDDVYLYNRVITPEEVQQIYKMGTGSKVSRSVTGVSTGLLAHWTFDGPYMLTNVADSSGNGRHGGLTGQTSTTTTIGVIGQALIFDGVNDAVSVSSFDADSITISSWVYQQSDNNQDGRIVSRSSDASSMATHDWTLFVDNDGSGNVATRLRTTGGVSDINSGYAMPNNVWKHIALTYASSTALVKFFVDGVEVYSTTNANTGPLVTGSGRPIGIGNQATGAGSRPFHGMLDDVRVYNRALPASEINELYLLGR